MRRKQRFRGDTAARWTANNPILGKFEPGYESDTDSLKIGDGVTAWADLPYFAAAELSPDIAAALNGANSPSASNVFATMDDLVGTNITELVAVISQTNTPPGSPASGDRYLVSTAPTGVWIGKNNQIAEWNGASYDYTVPVTNNTVYITASLTTKRYNGTSWVAYAGTALLQNGNTLGAPVSVGTRDNQVMYLRTNNANRVRVNNSQMNITGSLYIGSLTTTASAKVHAYSTTGTVAILQGASANVFSVHSDGTFFLGEGASAFDDTGVVIGKNAAVSSTGGIAIGVSSVSVADTVAIGNGASALINRGVAIGLSSSAASQGVSIGYAATTNDRGVTIGYSAAGTGSSVAIGESASAVGGISIKGTSVLSSQIAIGGTVSGAGLIALGVSSTASGDNGIAIGFRSRALGTDSIIIGRSTDNSTFLDNSTAQSFGIGWSETSPTVLFAKTADQYIAGTGKLGIGFTSAPTAKFQVRGTGTTSSTYSALFENSSSSQVLAVLDSRQVLVNGGGGDGEVFGIYYASVNSRIFVTYGASYSRRFEVYDNGSGTAYVSIGGANGISSVAIAYIAVNNAGNDGCLSLNTTASGNYQLYSRLEGNNYGHIGFVKNGTNRAFELVQDGSGHYILKLTSSASGIAHSLSSDGATNYLAGLSTQQLGIGNATPHASAKLEVTSTTMGFRITPMTATQASAITPSEGLMVCVSNTDATFTSIGFWGYENGAWAKL